MNWLSQLLHVPFVVVIAVDSGSAQLEISGQAGIARCIDAGVCIGLRLPLNASLASLNQASLLLASAGAVDDSIGIDAHGALLWRRHGLLDSSVVVSANERDAIWSERLHSQLLLLRRLATLLQGSPSAAPIDGSHGGPDYRNFV